MRRAAGTPIVLVVAAALALTPLGGCGNGGEGSTTTARSPDTPSSEPSQASPSPSSSPKPSSSKPDKEAKPPVNPPPPAPGSKAPAPGVPTSKEGDNSIQTWGLEASASRRAAASALVRRYLEARAARDWSTVCSLLAAKPRAEQSRYADGASCARAMASFAAKAQTSVLEEEAEIEVLSFRVSKQYAFLIYRRPDGVFATALAREGGGWRIVSVTPSPVG